jgi:hypothetical protein
MFDDIDHGKFFVVVGVTDEEVAGFFYINSNINSNVITKQEQYAMQYPILAQDYNFLKYDSYINATNIITRSKKELSESISAGRTSLVDSLKSKHLNDLLEKVRKSKLFSKIEKRNFFY